jgi:hypothetical protein
VNRASSASGWDHSQRKLAFAASSQAIPPVPDQTQSPIPAAVRHYDFEDDNVEGDLQRPDGELITSIPQAKETSLIEIRRNFIPEILKMIEDL